MMTPFQKKFVTGCLDCINEILSSEDKINETIKDFSKGDSNNQRYHFNKYITDSWSWAAHDKTRLSSVVSEAIVQTTFKVCTNDSLIKQLNEATVSFLETIVPKITINTGPTNRLACVKENIAVLQLEMNKDSELEIKNKSVQDNPYTFFSVLVGAAVIGATVLVLSNK